MTTGTTPPDHGMARQESYAVPGPAEVDVTIGAGRVEVRLGEDAEVRVEVRHAPEATGPFASGLTGLVSWVTSQFGGRDGEPADAAAEAVRQTRVELTGHRLVVRTPKALPLKMVPVAVTVHAPNGSQVAVQSGTADVTVSGTAQRLDVATGTGDVAVERAEGKVSVHTGSGAVRLGPMLGGLRARTGTGDLEVSSVDGPATLLSGSGDVWVGAARANVTARSGTGDLTIAEAATGRIELQTGSGEIRVGVREGVAAEVDLSSGSGSARSELPVLDTPPDTPTAVWLRGRSGSGNAVITSAAG
ncbi:putative adhesin [Streptoalloteichus tenebrarius]|uniref:Adhesin n=1 Tax=Streptoalloteichus tenebrarius (strain ATCC 17920 / DSM 40477 / JCM 4838 / CBS 697.72 / NBRC 16177 / NCIMB 11028 / NRRL B-12390 / A12253. 1 / ISP 5477) TaxID=1933 RepID=A0ABT1HN35_STRSD|nr:DUF4097 family beta strand repeat-containing protein [Streptoalloteichus tenebrarius]MCP2256921.1 putative adhesin [Streptoalloteichus tenebrarius]BFF00170.1 DUF4097 family beta strand repeat-containing protein [Streptoalloteichus tenebrarius]